MAKLTLYINGTAASTYGVSLDANGLSALMAPPPLKDLVTNTSEIEHGTRVAYTPRYYAERTFTLTMNMVESSNGGIATQFASFCGVLAGGRLNITTSFQPGVVYKCDYLSCQSFSEYGGKMAHIALRLLESNPNDRTASSASSSSSTSTT